MILSFDSLYQWRDDNTAANTRTLLITKFVQTQSSLIDKISIFVSELLYFRVDLFPEYKWDARNLILTPRNASNSTSWALSRWTTFLFKIKWEEPKSRPQKKDLNAFLIDSNNFSSMHCALLCSRIGREWGTQRWEWRNKWQNA